METLSVLLLYLHDTGRHMTSSDFRHFLNVILKIESNHGNAKCLERPSSSKWSLMRLDWIHLQVTVVLCRKCLKYLFYFVEICNWTHN